MTGDAQGADHFAEARRQLAKAEAGYRAATDATIHAAAFAGLSNPALAQELCERAKGFEAKADQARAILDDFRGYP